MTVTDRGREQPDPLYAIKAHPPVVSQVCLRCGAEIGSRAIHDSWHDKSAPTNPREIRRD